VIDLLSPALSRRERGYVVKLWNRVQTTLSSPVQVRNAPAAKI
jgi:hypothetical protein